MPTAEHTRCEDLHSRMLLARRFLGLVPRKQFGLEPGNAAYQAVICGLIRGEKADVVEQVGEQGGQGVLEHAQRKRMKSVHHPALFHGDSSRFV